MFYSKILKKNSNFKHCFFSRNNGTSKGIYKSLNCGPGSKDKKKDIQKNLEIVRKKIGKNSAEIPEKSQGKTKNLDLLSCVDEVWTKCGC